MAKELQKLNQEKTLTLLNMLVSSSGGWNGTSAIWKNPQNDIYTKRGILFPTV